MNAKATRFLQYWILPAMGVFGLTWAARYLLPQRPSAAQSSGLSTSTECAASAPIPSTAFRVRGHVFDLQLLLDPAYRQDALIRFIALVESGTPAEALQLTQDCFAIITDAHHFPVVQKLITALIDDTPEGFHSDVMAAWQALRAKAGVHALDIQTDTSLAKFYARDPQQAVLFTTVAFELFDAITLDELHSEIYSAMALTNPDAVIDKRLAADDTLSSDIRDSTLQSAFSTLAAKDPAAALARWQSLPEGKLRDAALEGLSRTWARKDPTTYYRWADALPGEQRRLSMEAALYNSEPTAICQWLDAHKHDTPGLGADWTAHHLGMSKLAESEPLEALQRFTTQAWPSEHLDTYFFNGFARCALGRSTKRSATVQAVLALPAGNTRRKLLDEIVSISMETQRADSYRACIQDLTTEQQATLREGASAHTLQLLQKLEGVKNPNISKPEIISQAVAFSNNAAVISEATSLAASDPIRAIGLIQKLPADGRAWAYYRAVLETNNARGSNRVAVPQILDSIPDPMDRQKIERLLAAKQAGLMD